MENSSSTQPGGPEKPPAVRFSSPAQHPANGPHAQQHLQPIELPRPEPFRTSKPFAVAKLALGSFNLAFAIIALGLSLGVITTVSAFDFFLGAIICISLAVASMIWQLAEHITLAARRGWRSIHAGAHVGVHLVLWILAVLTVLFLCVSLSYEMREYTIKSDCEQDRDDSSSSSSYGDGYSNLDDYYCDYFSFPSQAAADRYFRMLEALTAFSVLLFLSHFVLFVMACVETERRRKFNKVNRVVYLVAAPGPVDGRMYYTPVTAETLAGGGNRGSVLAPQPVHYQQQQQQQQQGHADPGPHGYYAPPAVVPPETAA